MKVVALGGARQYPPELIEQAASIAAAALAEVGVEMRTFWFDYSHGRSMAYEATLEEDDELLNKARALALDSVGIPWEWTP